jgi:hypothetical protein
MLHDRVLMMKLFWVGFIAGIVFIGIGVVVLFMDIFG